MLVIERMTAQQNESINRELENLLNNIYEKNLQKNEKAVTFVKIAIEQIVLGIVNEIIENKVSLFDQSLTALEPTTESTVPVLRNGIKYDQTRNNYPDELNFVYVPFQCPMTNEEPSEHVSCRLNQDQLRTKLHLMIRKCLTIKNDDFGEVKCTQHLYQHGDLSVLEFTFSRSERLIKEEKETVKIIHVKLVPGIKIYYPYKSLNRQQPPAHRHSPDIAKHNFFLKDASLGYIQNQYSNTSVADIDFMHKVLSKKHHKVYKLIKYLLSGGILREGDHTVKLVCEPNKKLNCQFTSYAMKVAMVNHHYECQVDDENIGCCIINILKWFLENMKEPFTIVQTELEHIYQIESLDKSNKTFAVVTGKASLKQDAEERLIGILYNLEEKRRKETFFSVCLYKSCQKTTKNIVNRYKFVYKRHNITAYICVLVVTIILFVIRFIL